MILYRLNCLLIIRRACHKVEGNRVQWVYTTPQEGRYEFILNALEHDGFFL